MTTSNNVFARARELPNGASFHRCALQVNPHHYANTFRGQPGRGDADAHVKAIVKKAAEIGVKVLAITDHNDVSGVPAFRDAAADRGIEVFPGFELSSSEGVHVLCIYPQDTTDDQLQRYLGEFGIRNTSPFGLGQQILHRDPRAGSRAAGSNGCCARHKRQRPLQSH